MEAWLLSSPGKPPRKSDVSKATHYALGRWPALMRYCNDGPIEIDNNAAERALRALALGRKNYLIAAPTNTASLGRIHLLSFDPLSCPSPFDN